ncbi:MAG: tol-pal system-associated acyl-CoA thioesterase [Gammaproteobacteria bacterium]
MSVPIRNGRYSFPVRVYYEDTDAGGVVYHANYVKFMERARSEWLRHLGFEQDRLRCEERTVFAVRRMSLDFIKPARFNDLLAVDVALVKAGYASLQLAQTISNAAGLALCTAEVRIACLDPQSLRPRCIPSSILKELHDGD